MVDSSDSECEGKAESSIADDESDSESGSESDCDDKTVSLLETLLHKVNMSAGWKPVEERLVPAGGESLDSCNVHAVTASGMPRGKSRMLGEIKDVGKT